MSAMGNRTKQKLSTFWIFPEERNYCLMQFYLFLQLNLFLMLLSACTPKYNF